MGEPYYFQGPVFHRMSAEQAWDSLVTLVNPEPDSINWTARERDKRDLDNRRQLAGLLDQTEASLLFEASKQVAAAMKEQNKEFDALRKELDEARAKNDKEKSKEIQRRLPTGAPVEELLDVLEVVGDPVDQRGEFHQCVARVDYAD